MAFFEDLGKKTKAFAAVAADKAKDTAFKLIVFAASVGAVCGLVMALCAPLFPRFYNTAPAVRALASQLLVVIALFLPAVSFSNACYFTLRCGGKTMVTLLFDSVFVWAVCIPLSWTLSRYTALPMLQLFLLCQLPELVKSSLGFFMVKGGSWIQNLTAS